MTSKESYAEFIEKGYRTTGERMLEMHRELSRLAGVDIDEIIANGP